MIAVHLFCVAVSLYAAEEFCTRWTFVWWFNIFAAALNAGFAMGLMLR